jgi:hypothetical protein
MTGHEDMNEHEGLIRRLERERPVPAPGFRGRLRRHLLGSAGERHVAPAGIRRLVFAYAGSGTALLLVALLGVAGAGPLAA